jgi:type II secretory pathway component PulJ
MKGLTLFEILVVIAISVLLLAAVLEIFAVADVSIDISAARMDLQQSVRQAIDGMTREARQASTQNVAVDPAGSRVTFLLPGVGNAISYYLAGNQLVREHPLGTTVVLANDITVLSFCCLGGTGCLDCSAGLLRISITAAKTSRGRQFTYSLTEKVRLRNE